MREKLYEFFFVWKSNGQPNDEVESALPKQLKESEIERAKFLQLQKEHNLQTFKERGGFSRILTDIFNPIT
jgi:hypothetical protein